MTRPLTTYCPTHPQIARPLTILILLAQMAIPQTTRAQDGTPLDWGAFNQHIDVTVWQGHQFKVTAAIRTQPLDPRAGAELWVRIDKTDKTMGFFYNMMDKPIKDSTWKVYTVRGKIDKNAKWLYFGGLYQHKGSFYFDDFHLEVETAHNKWQQIALPDPGFEDDTAAFNKNWFYLKKRTFFTPSLSTDNPYEGKQAIKVDGSKFTKMQTYGNNDTAGHFITANGIKLYYETYGQGQPLLLLHGNSSSISLFEKQIPDFAKQYQVIAVDTRGQGRSGEDGKTYTYDLFAEDMNAFLDSLHLDSVNIFGWSDGGNTGLIMAMNYPRKVRRLAAMGANVFIDHTVVDDSVYRILHKEQRETKHDTDYNSTNRKRLVNLLLTEPRHTFPQLESIHCPVLVMAGQYDLIKDEHTRQIAAHIPQSQLVIFPGGTHYEPADHPAAFNKTVLDFFNAP
jgi:pimeloyl-ACP methyl ester carboxylesterase